MESLLKSLSPPLSTLAFAMLLALLFTTMLYVASQHFEGNLQALGELFKMSEDLIAVSLLALGNGIPDLFSALFNPSLSPLMNLQGSLLLLGFLFPLCIVFGRTRAGGLTRSLLLSEDGWVKSLLGLLLVVATWFTLLFVSDTRWIGVFTILSFVAYFTVSILISKRTVKKQGEKTPTGSSTWRWVPPFLFVHLTMLPDWSGSDNKILLGSLTAFTSVPLIAVAMFGFKAVTKVSFLLPMLLTSTCVSLLLASTLWVKKAGKWIYSLYSFIVALAWFAFLSEQIGSALQGWTKAVGIQSKFPAAQIAAIGNSVGDVASNFSLALHGHVNLSILSLFSAIIQNTLLAFGISLLSAPRSSRADELKGNFQLIFSFCFVAGLVALCGVVPFLLFRLKVPRWYGFVPLVAFSIHLSLHIFLSDIF